MPKNNNLAIILIIVIILGGLYVFRDRLNTGSIVATETVTSDFHCNIVKECTTSCDDICNTYSDCTSEVYNGKNIACINGKKITVLDSANTITGTETTNTNGGSN